MRLFRRLIYPTILFALERERLRNKFKVELNPYFIYRRTAKTWTGYRERERALGHVLNLKVKPPPLLPNPCAEREGCSASTSHSTDLNSSRAPNSSMALFRCFKAPVVCRLSDTAFSSGNVTAGFSAICQETSPICKLRLCGAAHLICRAYKSWNI